MKFGYNFKNNKVLGIETFIVIIQAIKIEEYILIIHSFILNTFDDKNDLKEYLEREVRNKSIQNKRMNNQYFYILN